MAKKKIVVQESTLKEHIQELAQKKGKPPMPKHVLKLTDWLYIQADYRSWTVKEVVDSKKPNGEKYPDKTLLYYTTLEGAIKGAVRYGIKVPSTFNELLKKLDDIYSLIDARIPTDIKPQDLFTDLVGEEL